MSHCIHVCLAKKEFLVETPKHHYVELPHNIVAIPGLSSRDAKDSLKEGSEFLFVNTDYFGGAGEQQAALCSVSKRGTPTLTEYNRDRYGEINKALKEYGVVKENGKDEFDTINLGHYRSNSDFFPPEPIVESEISMDEKVDEVVKYIEDCMYNEAGSMSKLLKKLVLKSGEEIINEIYAEFNF